MNREDGESLFIRLRYGNLQRVQSNIVENLEDFVGKNKDNDNSLDIIKKLVVYDSDRLGKYVNIESTWYKLLEECYLIFENELSRNKFDYSLITELFRLLVKKTTIDEKWLELKCFILSNLDKLSMWEYSYNKVFAENQKIQRSDDGTYYKYVDNEIYQVIGTKTYEENKFDFIVSTTLGDNGSIYRLLKFIAIVFISINYQENPNKYPKSLSILLPESEQKCWFLRWEWRLERPYGYMKSGWRPYNNHCDPDWLVSDLLANYSEVMISKRETKKLELPTDEIIKQYEDAFQNYPCQLAFAIETDLIIGENTETYFDFKGKKIRWINRTSYLETIVVVPVKDLRKSEEEESILNEFISSLVWETGHPIRKNFHVGAASRISPPVSPVKNMGGFIVDVPRLSFNGNNTNTKLVLALALYKEGINSMSAYYSFLNYYKIVELLYNGNKNDIIKMINNNREMLIEKRYSNRINEIEGDGKKIGLYIYESCRCAVAHAGQINNTVNPDDMVDYSRISKDLPLIKEIAKDLVKSGQFN